MRPVAARYGAEGEWIYHEIEWLDRVQKGAFFLYNGNDQLEIGEVTQLEASEGWPSVWLTLVPEWVHHIEVSKEGSMQMTACGMELSHRWMFLGFEHAVAAEARGSRLLACAACMAKLP